MFVHPHTHTLEGPGYEPEATFSHSPTCTLYLCVHESFVKV